MVWMLVGMTLIVAGAPANVLVAGVGTIIFTIGLISVIRKGGREEQKPFRKDGTLQEGMYGVSFKLVIVTVLVIVTLAAVIVLGGQQLGFFNF